MSTHDPTNKEQHMDLSIPPSNPTRIPIGVRAAAARILRDAAQILRGRGRIRNLLSVGPGGPVCMLGACYLAAGIPETQIAGHRSLAPGDFTYSPTLQVAVEALAKRVRQHYDPIQPGMSSTIPGYNDNTKDDLGTTIGLFLDAAEALDPTPAPSTSTMEERVANLEAVVGALKDRVDMEDASALTDLLAAVTT